jgi:hypothetical protein
MSEAIWFASGFATGILALIGTVILMVASEADPSLDEDDDDVER